MSQDKKEQLTRRLKLKESSHDTLIKKGFFNEGDYQSSCKVIKDIYAELSSVCEELGEPIPVRMN